MNQKGKQPGRDVQCSSRADRVLPADRRGLSPSGMVRVRNVVSPMVSTRRVVEAPQGAVEGPGGKGGRRKRRSVCNGSDRGSSFAPPRKGADFRLVLIHETGEETLNVRSFFGQ